MKEESKKHGAFSWIELKTTDGEAAIKFYTKLFGWEIEKQAMEGMNYNILKFSGEEVGGIMSMPGELEGMPPAWSI